MNRRRLPKDWDIQFIAAGCLLALAAILVMFGHFLWVNL